MSKIYKFNHSEESRVFLTSDSHFRHTKLVESRGFKTIEEHDAKLIENWNNAVRPQDVVLFLGDFILGAGDKGKEVCLDLFEKLNGTITFAWGNHNSGCKQVYADCLKLQYNLDAKEVELYPLWYGNKVRFIGDSFIAQIKRENKTHFVFCSHFAHRIWIDNGGEKAVVSACGHSHSRDKESNADFKFAERLDIGVDNFDLTPISFDKFMEIMDTKQHTVLDHHDASINPSF